MAKKFKGRVVIGGNVTGEALVSHTGLNTLASYQTAAMKGGDKNAICSDQNNKDLYKKDMKDKIICLPQTIGSTTGGLVIQTIAKQGVAPKAMLFSEHVDSIGASGLILTNIWVNQKIVTIDQLGNEFLNAVKTGQQVEIKEDGTVLIA